MSVFKNISGNTGNIMGDNNSNVQQSVQNVVDDKSIKEFELLIEQIEKNIVAINNSRCKEKTQNEIDNIKEEFKNNHTISDKIKNSLSKIVDCVEIAFDSVASKPGEWGTLLTTISNFIAN